MDQNYCKLIHTEENVNLDENYHQGLYFFDTGREIELNDILGELEGKIPIGCVFNLIYN